jgi:hypothetical protein
MTTVAGRVMGDETATATIDEAETERAKTIGRT